MMSCEDCDVMTRSRVADYKWERPAHKASSGTANMRNSR